MHDISKCSSIKILLILLSVNIFWLLKVYPPSGQVTKECSAQGHTVPVSRPVISPTKCPKNPEVDLSFVHPLIKLENLYNENKTTSLAFDDLDLSYGRWDNQHAYKIKDFAIVGDQYTESSENSLICLATQSSVERLNSLAQVSANWYGPISVALFSASNEEFLILQYFITYMRLCFPNIKANATFHILIPRDYEKLPKVVTLPFILKGKFDCRYPEKTLKALLKLRTLKTLQWRQRNTYPQNHMRNLARKGCQSKYVFLTDIDIIPSTNIVAQLNDFFKGERCIKNCAYVIPTFEIDVRAPFPRSKKSLLRLIRKGLARPFHEKVFIYNQYATNFTKWLSTNLNETDVTKISHSVTNFEFLYEPFYIAMDNVPAHDERFTGYGFTRNSQVYEMHIAGFEFYVLTPVFTCHWGLQRKQTRPAWREQQNNINRKKFDGFKSEIFARYKTQKAGKNKILIR
ncbi:beta-1,4-glucuronyltransferase 1 [Drosophila tropicalis]|uniref:beta-1,4-glucuronyltransferase 1 n=1 Tax=Drosophila tropicalis TaxID=46794 RepID=UPI0035AB8A06